MIDIIFALTQKHIGDDDDDDDDDVFSLFISGECSLERAQVALCCTIFFVS